MALRARCGMCGLDAPAKRFATRTRKVIVVLLCPRCDVAKPKAKT